MSRKIRFGSRKTLSLMTALIVLFVAVSQHYGWLGQAQQAVVSNDPGLYTVSRYIDGDTLAIDMNGTNETVRMIGVDTPETHKPNTPVQCYGPAAAAYTKNTIESSGNKVRLELDPKSQNRDRYNRLLRYVYLSDGRLIQLESIKNGYGFAYTQFPFTKSDQFTEAQNEAKATNKGLWANCKPFEEANGRWQTENAS